MSGIRIIVQNATPNLVLNFIVEISSHSKYTSNEKKLYCKYNEKIKKSREKGK